MNKNFAPEKEKSFLNGLVIDYKDVSPYSQIKKDIILELIDSYLTDSGNNSGLQLGCANGYETDYLAARLNSLTVVDGSSIFIENLRSRSNYSNVTFVFSLFEEYTFQDVAKKYDYIFCNYILEHVNNPIEILGNL